MKLGAEDQRYRRMETLWSSNFGSKELIKLIVACDLCWIELKIPSLPGHQTMIHHVFWRGSTPLFSHRSDRRVLQVVNLVVLLGQFLELGSAGILAIQLETGIFEPFAHDILLNTWF
jgi:hypothetical protein